MVGAGGGIGTASVVELARRGFAVAAADQVPPTSDQAELAVPIDVTDEASVEAALAKVGAWCGDDGLSALVAAFGVTGSGSIAETSVADFARVLSVNLTGLFLVCRASLPWLARAERASIVAFSSSNAHTGGNVLSGGAYAAAKAGIEGFVRHLAVTLAPTIRANAIAPGPVRTPMLERLDGETIAQLEQRAPLGRVADAHEIAAVVGLLADDEGSFLTGTVVHQNGGAWLG